MKTPHSLDIDAITTPLRTPANHRTLKKNNPYHVKVYSALPL